MTTHQPRATAEEAGRSMADAAARLLQTTLAALDLADATTAQAEVDAAAAIERVTDLAGQVAVLTAANSELRTANQDLTARTSQSLAEADVAIGDARFARDDAAQARADQGRADAEHATERADTTAELARMAGEIERAQQAEAELRSQLQLTLDDMERHAAQAQLDLEQAATTAYATGRAEVLSTLPGLVGAATDAGQSAGRHAVLHLLDATSEAMKDQPLALIHSILTDALTDDTLPPGSPALLLEKSS